VLFQADLLANTEESKSKTAKATIDQEQKDSVT